MFFCYNRYYEMFTDQIIQDLYDLFLPSAEIHSYASEPFNSSNAVLLKNEVIIYQAVTVHDQFWQQLVDESSSTFPPTNCQSAPFPLVIKWFLDASCRYHRSSY